MKIPPHKIEMNKRDQDSGGNQKIEGTENPAYHEKKDLGQNVPQAKKELPNEESRSSIIGSDHYPHNPDAEKKNAVAENIGKRHRHSQDELTAGGVGSFSLIRFRQTASIS